MFLHAGANNPSLPLKLLQFRGYSGFRLDSESLWGSLFHNYDSKKQISLRGVFQDDSQAELNISLQPSSDIEYTSVIDKTPETEGQSIQLSLISDKELKYDYKHLSEHSTKTVRIVPTGFKVEPPFIPLALPVFFIPARTSLDPKDVAGRLGDLQIKRLGHHVVSCLKIIEPKLKALPIIPLGPSSTIHADIGRGRLFPLMLAGEGMSRLAEIAIDIASARDGIVLIDDIDTGFHHSVLPEIWKSIYKLALAVNAQIIATTHSAECIQTAHEVFSSNPKYDLSIKRLQRNNGSICVFEYDQDTTSASIETGLEMR